MNTAAMSIEFYLKTLTTELKSVPQEDGVPIVYSMPVHGHEPTKLLKAIPGDVRAKLDAAYMAWEGSSAQTHLPFLKSPRSHSLAFATCSNPVAKVAYGFGGGFGAAIAPTQTGRAKAAGVAGACAHFPPARWKSPTAERHSCRSSTCGGLRPHSRPELCWAA